MKTSKRTEAIAKRFAYYYHLGFLESREKDAEFVRLRKRLNVERAQKQSENPNFFSGFIPAASVFK